MDTIRSLLEKHRRLKERIHAFRLPLPPWGRALATAFYMSLPIIAGIKIMEKTSQISQDNIGLKGEKLDHKTYGGSSTAVNTEQRMMFQDILTNAQELKRIQDQNKTKD